MSGSIFADVPAAPRDPILGLIEGFNHDTRPEKVNLGVGVYFSEDGRIQLLGAVAEAVSLFLTERRLVRLRSTLSAYKQVTCDHRDDTVVDEVPLAAIHSLRMRRQIRGGEALVGLGIVGVAVIFYPWLAITGPLLIVLGALGMVHGLLLPTRWLEVQTRMGENQDPICIYVLRKKSARTLVRLLRERIPRQSIPI